MHKQEPSRIPALDGIRGISAWFVVAAHLGLLPFAFGALGVSIFFVLSGFLITWLLLAEVEKTGSVSLRNFYIRRTLRIFPAFYVFLGLTLLVAYFVKIPIVRAQAWADAIYMGDYAAALDINGPVLGIAWSLGIEEKFYLLWPWIFRRYCRNTKLLITIAGGICATCWAYRALMWFGVGVNSNYLRYAFESRLDGIMFGCLGALSTFRRPWRIPWFLPVIAAALVCVLTALPYATAAFDYAVGVTLISALAVTALIGFIGNANRFRWLDSTFLRFFGNISYSTYLYHILVIVAINTALPNSRWSLRVVLSIGLTVFCAWASQRFVEEPFLRLKKRYEVREVPHRGAKGGAAVSAA